MLHVGEEVAGGAQTEQPNKCDWNIGLITITIDDCMQRLVPK